MTTYFLNAFSKLLLLSIMVLGLSSPSFGQEEDESAPPLGKTYSTEEVLATAERFFGGEYSEGLKAAIEKAIQENGAPNGYYYGQEDQSITEIGYRYGSGRVSHADFGQQAVFWRGPSIGFDLEDPDTKTFALLFNFTDLKGFYKRYASGESGYFFYKGVALSYRKRLNMTIAQIRVGVEVSEGLNPAWIKFGPEKMVLPNVIPD